MTIKIPKKNKNICTDILNRNHVKPISLKVAISTNGSPIQKRDNPSNNHKQEFKTIASSLYFNGGLVTANNFSNLTHIHPSYFNNLNKKISVESFVGSSTGIFGR
jgi:hypothetical protein